MARDTRLFPYALTVEHRDNPLGLGESAPRLSWKVGGSGRDRRQSAYHVRVWEVNDGDEAARRPLWDSGAVAADHSVLIPYAGPRLVSRQRLIWTVQIQDEHGRWSPESEPARFEMGLLEATDWAAHWVTAGSRPGAPIEFAPAAARVLKPLPYLRTGFDVPARPLRARLYVTALGVYEPWLNGQRIGARRLAPGWSDYRRRLRYQTYDVTDAVRVGENRLGFILGEGWYAGYVGFGARRQHYGQEPALLAQCELVYADGRRQVIGTDASWQSASGPWLYSDLLMGEAYDARREREGWCEAGGPADGWEPVRPMPAPAVPITAERAEGVQVTEEVRPQAVWSVDEDTWLYDLGRNLVGVARLEVQGPRGTRVRLRFGEMLDADGRLYVENLRAAAATDFYILKGGAQETFSPRFTFHGFRYVEVTGFPGRPTLETLTVQVMESVCPPTGRLLTSSRLVNRLQQNIVASQRSNFLAVPTDCPQRDERLGWLGDAQVFCRTAAYNRNVAAFFTEWLETVGDSQSPAGAFPDVAPRLVDEADGAPGWGDAGVIIPWVLYQMYGDVGLLGDCFPRMRAWVEYIAAANPDGIWRVARHNDFGDWLSVGADTPKDLLATAYFAGDARILAQAARVLDDPVAADRYDRLYRRIREAFQTAFIKPSGRIHGETQTGYLLALALDLVPVHLAPAAVTHLAENLAAHDGLLTTGFLGVSLLAPELSRWGRDDLAYQLLLETRFPSWGYPIRHGATTIWERWDGWTRERGFQTPEMNSFNHYALGSVGEFLYREVAGIDTDPDAPGFARWRIRPHVHPALAWVRARYDSIRGPVGVSWRHTRDGGYTVSIEVPPNTTARVALPLDGGQRVWVSSRAGRRDAGFEQEPGEPRWAARDVGSGRHRFIVAAPTTA